MTNDPEKGNEEVSLPIVQVDASSDLNPLDVFRGVSSKAVSEEVARILQEPIDPQIVEIKPDGLVYLPEIQYRRILNRAFGPQGWGMVPMGKAEVINGVLMREWAMWAGGRFVSSTIGEADYVESNPNMSYATCHESAKSNALMRCCKDLGIASELWDKSYIEDWKQKYARGARCTRPGDSKVKYIWTKNGQKIPYPWTEVAGDRSTREGSPARKVNPSTSPAITPSQIKMIMALMHETGFGHQEALGSGADDPDSALREFRIKKVSEIIGRDITSTKDLTAFEASKLIDVLKQQ